MVARGWLIATILLVAGIVAVTSAQLLVHPQLEPDDYRYLRLVDEIRAGQGEGLPAAFVVENRWDHLWFVASDAVVRFFRPTVVTSFLLDSFARDQAGQLLATNQLLHLGCALLVALLLFQLLGRSLPACLGSCLFAAFACHAETIWYVSGRNETLAALGFLAALTLHIAGGVRPWLRWAALPCYAFALLSKELTIGLPAFCWLHDWLWARRGGPRELLRADWRLYAGHAAILAGFLLLRTAVLGSVAAPMAEPYFVSPLDVGFLPHLGAQVWSYGENLLLGHATPPFLQAANLFSAVSLPGLLLPLAAFAACVWLLRADRRFWFLLLLALGTWLPTSFVYISERYLYLPSVAVAATAALLLARQPARSLRQAAVATLLAIWTIGQGCVLYQGHRFVARMPRDAMAVAMQLQQLEPQLPRGGRLLFVNLPGDVVHAQFLQDQLRVVLGDGQLSCRVLTLAPQAPTGDIALRRVDAHTLDISAQYLLMQQGGIFPIVAMPTGALIERPRSGCDRVEIRDGDGASMRSARFRLQDPLDDCTIVRFEPPLPWPEQAPNSDRILRGRFVLEHP